MSTPEATIEHPNVSVKMEAQLPDELLLNIFGHLPQQSLRNARLVNNQWNAVSTPLVFERIHLSLISWSLAKVLALSQSPLAKHVKAIDFHTEKLYEIYHETYRKYSVDIRAPFFCRRNQPTSSNQVMHDCWKESKPRRHYTRDQLEAGWRAYETYRGESDRRIGLADCILLLNDCLPKFRNLREVVADRIKRSGISRIDATAYWNNLKRTILINPFSRERHGDAIGTADGAVPTSVLLMALGNRSRVEGCSNGESYHRDAGILSPRFHIIPPWISQTFRTRGTIQLRGRMGSAVSGRHRCLQKTEKPCLAVSWISRYGQV